MFLRSFVKLSHKTFQNSRTPNQVCASLHKMSSNPENPRKRGFDNKSLNSSECAKPRKFQKSQRIKKKEAKKLKNDWPEGDKDDVLRLEIQELLQDLKATNLVEEKDTAEAPSSLELQKEVDFEILKLSSTGHGLAFHKPSGNVAVVPFSVPSDIVTAKPYKHVDQESYYLTDFKSVKTPSSSRDDSRIRCQYFSRCSGCQFQMLHYQDQLAHKKTVVQNAYRWFSKLEAHQIPTIQDTMGSPLQYGYRTKLTPHFDGPPGHHSAKRKGQTPQWDQLPSIGFMLQGTRETMDIEDCPIGTEPIRNGLKQERARIAASFKSFSKGATLILRETTERIPKDDTTTLEAVNSSDGHVVIEDRGNNIDLKRCITNPKGTSMEYVDDHVFSNPASAFFQNNNSILSPFMQYIRNQIQPDPSQPPKVSYLVDAYCGSGLFTIMLSSIFKKSIGIDIAESSIEYATKNAKQNNLDESQATFLAADASQIFAKIKFPASETLVVIDPPRKGSDKPFLSQLLRFGPAKIVYVSCNVNTQARDIGYLVNGIEGVDAGLGPGKGAYDLLSLRGFDFFPQTGHVEGVAVLEKRSAADQVTNKVSEDDGAKHKIRNNCIDQNEKLL